MAIPRLLSLMLFSTFLIFEGCSAFNPNPGETEADTYLVKKDYAAALAIIEPLAEQNIPWAQLRLGIAWEYGQGKTQNHQEALHWYRKVAVQRTELPWADGVHLISAGEKGFFNQNNDAKVAQYLIARLYYQGGKGVKPDLAEAWLWSQYVYKLSEGNDILYCCEKSKLKTQKIEGERITKLLQDIEKALPEKTLEQLKIQAQDWQPR